MRDNISNNLKKIKNIFDGEIYTTEISKLIYSTDASVYREKPLAVVCPKSINDIKQIISFARANKTSLIPRGAGTSLAGQVVGNGIVVDISKHLNQIIELNQKEKWIRVQPGVILDELNIFLEKHKLFFGPETSTSNRCVMGGMVGNNSCGSHSLIYGSTRDHTLEIKTILSDGSEAVFKSLTSEEFHNKCKGNKLENKLYQNIHDILSDTENQKEIKNHYPDPELKRRNTGYALDLLLDSEIYMSNNNKFNFCKLIAGSEGTLAFITEIKLNLVPLPPKEKAVVCVHFKTKEEAFHANLIALKHNPGAIELMDDKILELTKGNIDQNKNRFFVKDDPAAILIIEFARDSKQEITKIAQSLEDDLRKEGFGYHFPVIYGNDINKVWSLRKAGLGLLSNMVGDAKPVSLIEDTAVHVKHLPAYLNDFEKILKKYKKECVYHAHIGTGELHLRPVLNLKNKKDVELFHTIGKEVALLVKKYKGSLSGEHGDGRLRGEFIPLMIGEKNYQLLKMVKKAWDPDNIFNPGKIVDTPRMNTHLRYKPGEKVKNIDTIFDFSNVGGIIRAAEKCNGSGDCRKSELIGGTMCPSYMATRDEKHVTRARANLLREVLTNSNKSNPFNHKELYDILDLCISCKACKSECPSSVDVAKLKAEFLQHYYDANGISIRTRLIAYISSINKIGIRFSGLFNVLVTSKLTSNLFKFLFGFSIKRSIPKVYKLSLTKWIGKNLDNLNNAIQGEKNVVLLVDEFTNYNDVETGVKTIKLLNALNYKVIIHKNTLSGRTFLSKGLLRTAKKIADKNVSLYKDIINMDMPLIGVEPSAILAFRDEYPELVSKNLREDAKQLALNCFMVDELIARAFYNNEISKELFTREPRKIKLHGHCQQKAIASTSSTKKILSIPANYHVEEIPSGCCGMAGSFGYEREHYDVSMKIGELVLFPEVRKLNEEFLIVAPGTSCRHQIYDGTGRKAYHPVEVLYDALL